MNREALDGPAFPRPASTDDTFSARCSSQTGMTLRDYFAAKALQGLLAGRPDADCEVEGYCHDAYQHADAMLVERIK